MKYTVILLGFIGSCFMQGPLFSHCQMPCGIYHDEMVYDQIDQYVETMAKGITVLDDTKFSTTQEKNAFIRWVISKDSQSDNIAELLTSYFLQQKIKPGEDDTAKRLVSVHNMLFYLVQIKQNTDMKFVQAFSDEWEKFKLMFHVEGYECRIHTTKFLNLEKRGKELKENGHSHDHDHDHTH